MNFNKPTFNHERKQKLLAASAAIGLFATASCASEQSPTPPPETSVTSVAPGSTSSETAPTTSELAGPLAEKNEYNQSSVAELSQKFVGRGPESNNPVTQDEAIAFITELSNTYEDEGNSPLKQSIQEAIDSINQSQLGNKKIEHFNITDREASPQDMVNNMTILNALAANPDNKGFGAAVHTLSSMNNRTHTGGTKYFDPDFFTDNSLAATGGSSGKPAKTITLKAGKVVGSWQFGSDPGFGYDYTDPQASIVAKAKYPQGYLKDQEAYARNHVGEYSTDQTELLHIFEYVVPDDASPFTKDGEAKDSSQNVWDLKKTVPTENNGVWVNTRTIMAEGIRARFT